MPLHTAMILAAGRGQRMRPLTDHTPKPLLMAGQYRLIEWQILALVKAGVQRIVINHAWLGEQYTLALGDGSRYGCQLLYSPETPALETAGGIARALPLLGDDPFIVVSGDIYCEYDYRSLPTHLTLTAAHLVLVPNPGYHPAGDMGLRQDEAANRMTIDPQASIKWTYANIGVFNAQCFRTLPANTPHKLFPWLYQQGTLTGELFEGVWHNVGTPSQLAALNEMLAR